MGNQIRTRVKICSEIISKKRDQFIFHLSATGGPEWWLQLNDKQGLWCLLFYAYGTIHLKCLIFCSFHLSKPLPHRLNFFISWKHEIWFVFKRDTDFVSFIAWLSLHVKVKLSPSFISISLSLHSFIPFLFPFYRIQRGLNWKKYRGENAFKAKTWKYEVQLSCRQPIDTRRSSSLFRLVSIWNKLHVHVMVWNANCPTCSRRNNQFLVKINIRTKKCTI